MGRGTSANKTAGQTSTGTRMQVMCRPSMVVRKSVTPVCSSRLVLICILSGMHMYHLTLGMAVTKLKVRLLPIKYLGYKVSWPTLSSNDLITY